MALLPGVPVATVVAAGEGDAFALSDHAFVGSDVVLGALMTVDEVAAATGTVGLSMLTGTDALPHATVPSNVEIAKDTIAARWSRLPVEIALFIVVPRRVSNFF